MSKLIEKMSYEKREEEIQGLMQRFVDSDGAHYSLTEMAEYIDEQVQLAYIAGWNRFNAITHECVEFEESEGMEARWHELEEEFPLVGPDSQLPSIYSQSKGFKP